MGFGPTYASLEADALPLGNACVYGAGLFYIQLQMRILLPAFLSNDKKADTLIILNLVERSIFYHIT